jgi:hypothetical protein
MVETKKRARQQQRQQQRPPAKKKRTDILYSHVMEVPPRSGSIFAAMFHGVFATDKLLSYTDRARVTILQIGNQGEITLDQPGIFVMNEFIKAYGYKGMKHLIELLQEHGDELINYTISNPKTPQDHAINYLLNTLNKSKTFTKQFLTLYGPGQTIQNLQLGVNMYGETLSGSYNAFTKTYKGGFITDTSEIKGYETSVSSDGSILFKEPFGLYAYLDQKLTLIDRAMNPATDKIDLQTMCRYIRSITVPSNAEIILFLTACKGFEGVKPRQKTSRLSLQSMLSSLSLNVVRFTHETLLYKPGDNRNVVIAEINCGKVRQTIGDTYMKDIEDMNKNCFNSALDVDSYTGNTFLLLFEPLSSNKRDINFNILGYCFLSFIPGKRIYIHTVCVNPKIRNRKACSTLFSFITWKYGPTYDMELHVRSGPFEGIGLPPNIPAFKCYNKHGFYIKNPPEWKVATDGVNHIMHRLVTGNTITNSLFIDLNQDPITPVPPDNVQWEQIITA